MGISWLFFLSLLIFFLYIEASAYW